MTLIDLIKLGIVKSHGQAEKMAADLVDCWHNKRIQGELHDVLGLTPREYQAWTTGGVSLLTIANWQQNSRPALSANRPWFKLGGKPPFETVGYLEEKAAKVRKNGTKAAAR